MAMSAAMSGPVGLQLLLYPATSAVVARAACTAVGVCLPAYSTYKALESKSAEDQEQWLTYWAAYGCVHVVEIFSDKLLSWFPYYYHAKLAFLVWLQLPNNLGATQLYVNWIRPFFAKHRGKIDGVLDKIRAELNSFIGKHRHEIEAATEVLWKTFMEEGSFKGISSQEYESAERSLKGTPQEIQSAAAGSQKTLVPPCGNGEERQSAAAEHGDVQGGGLVLLAPDGRTWTSLEAQSEGKSQEFDERQPQTGRRDGASSSSEHAIDPTMDVVDGLALAYGIKRSIPTEEAGKHAAVQLSRPFGASWEEKKRAEASSSIDDHRQGSSYSGSYPSSALRAIARPKPYAPTFAF